MQTISIGRFSVGAPALVWVALCGIWGSTWLGVRIGLNDLPPLSTPQDAEIWLEKIGRGVATGTLSASKGATAASCVRAWLSAHEQGKVTEQVADLRQQVEELKAR